MNLFYPLEYIANSLTGFIPNPDSHFSQSINFFIYDSLKIIILLLVLITLIAFLRTYITQNKIKKYLNKKSILANISASFFGAITPFCSCSSIPIFLSFLEAGVPLGVAFSFLITSPLVNEYMVAIMLGFFGWKITLIYVLSGILIGIFAGLILGKMKLEKHLVNDLINKRVKEEFFKNIRQRIFFGLNESILIIKKIWLYVIIGILAASFIHGYVPELFIQNLMQKTGFFSIPLAVLLGIPLYANSSAILPIITALFEKGVPLGTSLAFMMSTIGLSFPEAVILRRVMKLKLILIFFGIVALAIIFTGYLLNIIQVLL